MVNVSIIIPVYNKEKYLRKCINSILNQTYTDVEIILIDDGSLDRSKQILSEYKDKFPQKITVLESFHKGVGNARNRGIKRANGKYILFIDADDYLRKDYISKLMEFAKFDLVVSGLLKQNLESKNIESSIKLIDSEINTDSKSIHSIYTKSLFPIFSVVYTKLFKKRIIDRYHLLFKNQQYGEDTLFMLDIKRIKLISYAGYINLIINNTLSRDYVANIWDYLKVIPDEINEYGKCWQFLFLRSVKLTLLNETISFKKFRYQCKNITHDTRFQHVSTSLINTYSGKFILSFLRLKLYWLLFIIFKLKQKSI